MRLQRYRLQPVSSMGTPLKADTLAGQLLCLYAERHGQEAMTELVSRLRQGEVPFVVSDAFPTGCLPGPVLPPLPRKAVGSLLPLGATRQERFALLRLLKEFNRQLRYLSLEQWQQFRSQLSLQRLFEAFRTEAPPLMLSEGAWRVQTRAEVHNIINRHTGRVLQEGGLFTEETTWYARGQEAPTLDLYVLTEQDSWAHEVEELLHRMGQLGFGRDASTGKGHFQLLDSEDASALLELKGANAHMTLSTCATQQPEAVQGWYRLKPKFGKVWNGFGELRPFKKPLLMYEAGAVFTQYPTGWGQGILTNIHRSNPAIVQQTTALLVPLTLNPQEAA